MVTPTDDGMAELWAYLPATAATTIYETVTACARQAATPGDERTADQRRADAFIDLILGTHTGPVAQVRVTVPALADFVRARDRTCRFPGCRRSAEKCELDHRIEHPDRPTSADNLDALCPHHHQLKHHSEWSGYREPNGDYVWISPAGLRYTARAEPVGEPAAKEPPPLPVCDPPPF